jgi:hypothetical protein
MKQIDAAQEIYKNYMEGWRRADDALTELDKAITGFGHPAALIKAAAVDKLYWTNVYYIGSAALHVEEVLDGCGRAALALKGPGLVEDMAAVEVSPGRIIHYRSFASKFAHFFIDHDRFPIYDKFAIRMLREHLGSSALKVEPTYMAFHEAFQEFAKTVGPDVNTRQLV